MLSTYLITGAQGFIGRYVASSILNSSPAAQVFGIGRSERLGGFFTHTITGPEGPMRAPLPDSIGTAFESDRYLYQQADLLEFEQIIPILEEFRPQKIVHLASGLRGDTRKSLFETNVEGTARLFEAAGKIEDYSPLIVLGSSGGVYGEAMPDQLPLLETAPKNPIDEYSISKLSAELLAKTLARRFGFPLRIARIFNVIGPGQDERHVAGQMAAELLGIREGRQEYLRLGALTSTRDFIDVRDVASALLLLLRDGVPDGVFNVASGVESSIERLLEAFLEVAGFRVEHAQEPLRIDDIPRHFADIGRIASLSFKPHFGLATSAQSVWSYYENLWTEFRLELPEIARHRSGLEPPPLYSRQDADYK